MRSQLVRLLPRTDYDFSVLSAGTVLANIPLVQNVDISQWGTGTLIVRVHSDDTKVGNSFRIDARSVAPTDEDPARFFRGGIVATVLLALPPGVSSIVGAYETRLTDNAGVAISLFLSVNKAVGGTHSVTVSVDLLLQERAVGWTPAALGSRLTLWLDQRDQVSVSGAYSDWGDQSPGGNQDFTQGTAGNRPAEGAEINGFSAPSFDGSSDSMGSSLLSAFISASAYHVFVVLRAKTISGTNGTVYLNNGVIADGGAGWWGLYLKLNGADYEAHGFHWDTGVKEAVATGFVPTTDCLVEWSFDGSSIRCRIGGSPEVTTTGIGNVGSLTNPVSIGTGPAGSLFLDGAIAAVLVCNARLSDAEIRNTRGYLSSRYGVPA